MPENNHTRARRPRAIAHDRTVGRRLKELRIRKGLQQAHIAEALDLTYQAVHKMETGRSRISAGRLLALAELLGVEPSELLEEPEGLGPDESERQVYRAAMLFRKLTAVQRASILQLLNSLQPDDDQ